MLRATATLPLLAALSLLPRPLTAQVVVGVVLDASTDAPVAGAEVALRAVDADEFRSTLAGDDGAFAISVAGGGSYTVTVSRIGYRTFTSRPIGIAPGERLVLEVRIGVEVVALEPIIVTERSRRYPPDVTAFYERMERNRRSGAGTFISRADVEDSFPARTSDLLRSIGGVQVVHRRGGRDAVVRMRGGCIPAIYVDGAFLNRVDRGLSLDDYVAPSSIEGIEVYRGMGWSVEQMYDPRGCGLILVWTRRGERNEARPLRWKTLAIVLGAVLGLLLLLD